MTPQLLPPPEIATAQPPAWAVASALLLAVVFAAGFTFATMLV